LAQDPNLLLTVNVYCSNDRCHSTVKTTTLSRIRQLFQPVLVMSTDNSLSTHCPTALFHMVYQQWHRHHKMQNQQQPKLSPVAKAAAGRD